MKLKLFNQIRKIPIIQLAKHTLIRKNIDLMWIILYPILLTALKHKNKDKNSVSTVIALAAI